MSLRSIDRRATKGIATTRLLESARLTSDRFDHATLRLAASPPGGQNSSSNNRWNVVFAMSGAAMP